MLKNFVIVKHMEDNGKYLFFVPKKISLEVGDKVVCDTKRGKDKLGVCCCDSFMADPAVVCPLFGTQVKMMQYVTGKVEYERFEIEKSEDEYEERFGEG